MHILIVWSLLNFAHATTAMLLWHMQIFYKDYINNILYWMYKILQNI